MIFDFIADVVETVFDVAAFAVLAPIALIAVAIDKIIDKLSIKEEMSKNDLNDVIIAKIDRNKNIVQLDDLNSSNRYEMQGTDVSDELREGMQISIH